MNVKPKLAEHVELTFIYGKDYFISGSRSFAVVHLLVLQKEFLINLTVWDFVFVSVRLSQSRID